MILQDIRKEIDAIDPQIRELIMRRMDCSEQVAQAKIEAGETNIYRADREAEILKRLSEGIPEERKACYISVVKKIMEASRMYQYGIMYDRLDGVMDEYLKGIPLKGNRVRIRLTRDDRPGSMAEILSMIGDYGYDMTEMKKTGEDSEAGTVTFELEITGDLSCVHMRKLMFQLSRESKDFGILSNECGRQ